MLSCFSVEKIVLVSPCLVVGFYCVQTFGGGGAEKIAGGHE